VLNIVKTITPDREQELVLARANAITNQVYYLSVNAAGPLGWGQSIHVGPEGEVLARIEHAEPEVTHLEIDLDRVTEVRRHGTAGLNRVWEQLRADDDPIDLPVYEGRMAHGRWQPGHLDPRSADD
jgi:predicted amidohydrolase